MSSEKKHTAPPNYLCLNTRKWNEGQRKDYSGEWQWRAWRHWCAQTIEGELQMPQEVNCICRRATRFCFNYGTNEINTRRLYQILCSLLHMGTCLTLSKDCRIYPGARCLTERESDLTLFDCQKKMTSDLFLFLLIHKNSYEQFPTSGYKKKTF